MPGNPLKDKVDSAQDQAQQKQPAKPKKQKSKSKPTSGGQSTYQSKQQVHKSGQVLHKSRQIPYKAKQKPYRAKHPNLSTVNESAPLNDSKHQNDVTFLMQSKFVDDKVTHALKLLRQEFEDLTLSKYDLHQRIMKYLVGEEGLDPNKLDESVIAMEMHKYIADLFVRRPRGNTVGTLNKLLNEQMYSDKVEKLHRDPKLKAQYIDQMYGGSNMRPKKDAQGKLHQGIDLHYPVNSEEALQQLFIHAELSQKEFDARLGKVQYDLSKSSHRKVIAHKSDIKGWERAYDKQQNKYHDASLIKDLVRGTLVFNSVTDLMLGRNHIYEHFTVYGTKNSFGQDTDTGYRDMKINVKLDTGHIGELQLHIQSMEDSKKHGGHGLYRFIRDFDEGKTSDFSDDPDKAVQRLKPILEVLEANKSKATTKQQGIEQGTDIESVDELFASKNDRKIAFVNWLISGIKDQQKFDLTQEEGKLLKEISRDVYASAGAEIDKEIMSNAAWRKYFKGQD